MRAGPTAVAVSIGVHVLLAVGIVLLLRRQPDEPHSAASQLETRADVHLEFVKDIDPPLEPNSQFAPDPPASTPPQPTPEPPIESVPDGPPKAQAIIVPQTLPPELLSILRKPQTPSPIQQATAIEPKPKGPAWAESGSPVHGALEANQRIVYVLDASGSMGEWAKFDVARAALIATLKLQPPTVRFQVVVYAGSTFTPVKSAPNECLAATPENLARNIEALAALPSPAGRSQHLDGLRAALAFRPDLVVLFTDADDLPPGPVRGVLKQAERKAVLCVAKATAKGVERPVEVK
jgi:hypothetical protein